MDDREPHGLNEASFGSQCLRLVYRPPVPASGTEIPDG